MTLTVTDPHMHLWDLDRLSYGWLNTPGTNFLGDYSALAKNHLPADFLAAAEDIVVDKTVHIEAVVDPEHRIDETVWLEEQAEQSGHPTAIVASVDLSSPGVEGELKSHAAHRHVRGVRQILNRHPDPVYNYVEIDYLQNPAWRRAFGQLAHLGLSFDLQLYPHQMPDAAELAAAHPDVAVILNHAGMFADRGDVAGWRAWRDGMELLSRHKNVSVKISGLGMFDHAWTAESLRPYVLHTIDCFGIERTMFASNFPVDSLFSSYSRLWRAYESIVADFHAADREALFRNNANRIYRI